MSSLGLRPFPARDRGGLEELRRRACALGYRSASPLVVVYANSHRSWQLFEKVFYESLNVVAAKAVGRKKFRFENKPVSLDSTVIDSCLSRHDRPKFRRAKGVATLHLVLDHDGYLSCFGLITDGKVHDVKAATQSISLLASSWWMTWATTIAGCSPKWTDAGVFFVTRMKDDALFGVVETHAAP